MPRWLIVCLCIMCRRPRLACLPLLIRLAHPSRPYRPVVRVVSLLACPSRLIRLVPSCLSVWHVRLVSPVVSLCFSYPSFVSPGGEGGCVVRAYLLGVASGRRESSSKKAGGDVCFPVRLSVLLSDVIDALVVVVQITLLADDIAVRSARADMRVCVAWLELLAHTGTVRPAFDIQD